MTANSVGNVRYNRLPVSLYGIH